MFFQYGLFLKDFKRVLRKRITFILFITVILFLISYIISRSVVPKPTYQATAEIQYNPSLNYCFREERDIFQYYDIINTQVILIKGLQVMEEAVKELGLIARNVSHERIMRTKSMMGIINSIKKHVTVKRKDRTNIIHITAYSPDAKIAQKLSNSIAEVYQNHTHAEFNNRLQEYRKVLEEKVMVLEEKMNDAEQRRFEILSALKRPLRSKDIKKGGGVLLSGQSKIIEDRFSLSPEDALELARLERELKTNENLMINLKSQYDDTTIKLSQNNEIVRIIRPAVSSPDILRIPYTLILTGIGIIISFFLSITVAFIKENQSTMFRLIEATENYAGMPVLGVIPEVDLKHFKEKYAPDKEIDKEDPLLIRYISMVSHFTPRSIVAEAYRFLRTNLNLVEMKKKAKSIVITSPTMCEGKTTNLVNLALTMAQTGKKVLIVESDLRKPTIHTIFGLSKEPGLTDVMLGNFTWKEVAKNISDLMIGKLEISDIMKTPGLDNISIITCGSIPFNPSELLGSQKMADFISDAERHFDVLLFDTPPILLIADALILGHWVDGILLVYNPESVARRALMRAKKQLTAVKDKVFGIIINRVKAQISNDYYKDQMNYLYKLEEENGTQQLSPIPLTNNHPWVKALLITFLAVMILVTAILLMDFFKVNWSMIPLKLNRLRGFLHGEKAPLPSPKTFLPPFQTKEGSAPETVTTSPQESKKTFPEIVVSNYYPYSILISSNQNERNAIYDWRTITEQGHTAFINPVYIKERGEFYRVFAGIFQNKTDASNVENKIKGRFTSTLIYTPYVLEVGIFDSKEFAEKEKENLLKKGYFPYILPLQEKYRLLLGAFTSPEEKAALSKKLTAEGISSKMVRR